MEKIEFIKAFGEIMVLNGLEMSSEAISESFWNLSNLLSEANKIHNLTAIKEDEEVIVKHFVDSLLASESMPNGAKMIDVGCGAGFPSLPLAIYRSDLSIIGVDSTGKKINYVNETAAALGLTNISAMSCRAEDLSHKEEYREAFDVATARAVAALPVLCELCLPFVKVGGYFVALKAQSADDELELSRSAIEKCGGELVGVVRKDLKHRKDGVAPESRNIIIIKKIKNTPNIYPRIYSKIAKKPL